MKKINLNVLGVILTPKELRNVTGGSIGCYVCHASCKGTNYDYMAYACCGSQCLDIFLEYCGDNGGGYGCEPM